MDCQEMCDKRQLVIIIVFINSSTTTNRQTFSSIVSIENTWDLSNLFNIFC